MMGASYRKRQWLISVFFVVLYFVGFSGANVAFGTMVWEGRISRGVDDWEQLDPGEMRHPGNSDLGMPYEDIGKGDKQIVGIRFLDVRIPKWSKITNAYIEFVCDETKDGSLPVSLLIKGEANPEALSFNPILDIAGRTRTAAKVIWEPVSWTEAGQVDRTSDISEIIEEIVNLDGWARGNALVLIISDNPNSPSQGLRCAESFDGSLDRAPLLHIEVSPKYAHNPIPPDNALYDDTWVALSWIPGHCAVSHDVYLGKTFDFVENATNESETFRGNQTSTFYVAGFSGYTYSDGLVPGNTYYWRIDEINEADPNSPWKGDVWSFSIVPRTAYCPNPADGAEFVEPTNMTISWTPGFGAVLHTVYFCDHYNEINNATGGLLQNTTTYNPGPLEIRRVYYWRVDEFDGIETYKGNVWSFTTPSAVGNPQPSYGAIDVAMNATLSWMPADGTAWHEVYFGTDKEAVRSADTSFPEYKGSKALGAESYNPGLLESDTTYYWRVNEVDGQDNTATGPLWHFTTGDYVVVDDFESYTENDRAGEAIWQTWIDGFGIPENGSIVGELIFSRVDQTIVHGGRQSMPYYYDNSSAAKYSEATANTADLIIGQDWTIGGVEILSLWFYGDPNNAPEPMYVGLANVNSPSAVVYHDNPDAVLINEWTEWRIDLQEFAAQGVDLLNVDSTSIGFGDKNNPQFGDSGKVFFDDIRLYRPQFVSSYYSKVNEP